MGDCIYEYPWLVWTLTGSELSAGLAAAGKKWTFRHRIPLMSPILTQGASLDFLVTVLSFSVQ